MKDSDLDLTTCSALAKVTMMMLMMLMMMMMISQLLKTKLVFKLMAMIVPLNDNELRLYTWI